MRLSVGRVLAALLTFTVGLCAVLMWRGIINVNQWRQLAARFARPAAPVPHHRVIFDRRNYVDRRMTDEEFKAGNEQERAWTQRVAPDVFGQRGLETYGGCDGYKNWDKRAYKEADLDWAVAAGQFVPRARAAHKGSFTGPHVQETLYEIDTGECNARWGPLSGSKRFAIYEGDKLRVAVKASVDEDVYIVVSDTDGDGVDELLLARGVEPLQWSFLVQMQLISLKDGTRHVLHDFGIAYIYGFADFFQNIVITLPLIYCVPGDANRAPEYHAHFFRASCRRDEGCKDFPPPSAWRYYKSGRLKLADYVQLWPQAIEAYWWHEVMRDNH